VLHKCWYRKSLVHGLSRFWCWISDNICCFTGRRPATLFAIGATFGFIIMIMIYALGHISGTHINPSVTIALALVKRFPAKLVIP